VAKLLSILPARMLPADFGIAFVVVLFVPAFIAAWRMVRLRSYPHYRTVVRWATIAVVAGFLFSTFSLIRVFAAVASTDAASKATLLAAGISDANPPFRLSLVIGIPLVVIAAFLKGLFGIVKREAARPDQPT
jgi:hypothetical protein